MFGFVRHLARVLQSLWREGMLGFQLCNVCFCTTHSTTHTRVVICPAHIWGLAFVRRAPFEIEIQSVFGSKQEFCSSQWE